MAKMTMKCPRCEGRGVIPRYYYNKKGVCFLCWGKKQIQTEVKPGETKDEAYARVRKREEDHMESQPPKAAIPEKFRNEKFAAIAELQAYDKGRQKATQIQKDAETPEAPKQTAVPKASKSGSIAALAGLPDYEGGELAPSNTTFRGKKSYAAPSITGEMDDMLDSVPLTKTSQQAKGGFRNNGKVMYRGVDHATEGNKVLKDQYTMNIGIDYQDSDVQTKITFNKKGEVSKITHYGTGMHKNRDALDSLALSAFTEKLQGVAERQGLEKPKVKLVGDAFVSLNRVQLQQEAAEAEAAKEEAERVARERAEEAERAKEEAVGLPKVRAKREKLNDEIATMAHRRIYITDSDDNKTRTYKTMDGRVIAEIPNPERSVQRFSLEKQAEIEQRRIDRLQEVKKKVALAIKELEAEEQRRLDELANQEDDEMWDLF